MTILVFLEHYGGELEEGGLGVLGKGRRYRRRDGGGARRRAVEVAAGRGRVRGRRRSLRAIRRSSRPCCRNPRRRARDARRADGRGRGPVRASVLSADVAAGLASRLDAGLNWDLNDLTRRPATSSGRDRRSVTPSSSTSAGSTDEDGDVPLGSLDPVESGGTAEVETFETTFSDFSTLATLVEQTTEESSGPSTRTPTSSSPAAAARLAGGIHDARGARRCARRCVGATRRWSTRAGNRMRRRWDRRESPYRRAFTRMRHLGRDPAKVGMQGSDDRRDQQDANAPIFDSATSASSATCIRSSEANGARALARLALDGQAIDFAHPFGARDRDRRAAPILRMSGST